MIHDPYAAHVARGMPRGHVEQPSDAGGSTYS
jgi:hypothetical protein